MYVVLEIDPGTTGIRVPDVKYPGIEVFPNPSQGFFVIDVPEQYDRLNISKVEVLDTGGKKIVEQFYPKNKKIQFEGPSGAYFVKLYVSQPKKGYLYRRLLVVQDK